MLFTISLIKRLKKVNIAVMYVMEKHFNKKIVLTKEDNEDFKNDNDYIATDVKVRDHCHITGSCRGSAHRY